MTGPNMSDLEQRKTWYMFSKDFQNSNKHGYKRKG